jgi:DNA-binding transcriptional regulator YiaG
MRRSKEVKNYNFLGFGFSVVLENVNVVERDGATYPDINVEALARKVMLYLTSSNHALTGSQVKFLRKRLGLTLEQFGQLLDVTHAAVCKWEAKKDNATEMMYATEVLLRMHVLSHLKTEKSFLDVFNAVTAKDLNPAYFETTPQIDIHIH